MQYIFFSALFLLNWIMIFPLAYPYIRFLQLHALLSTSILSKVSFWVWIFLYPFGEFYSCGFSLHINHVCSRWRSSAVINHKNQWLHSSIHLAVTFTTGADDFPFQSPSHHQLSKQINYYQHFIKKTNPHKPQDGLKY